MDDCTRILLVEDSADDEMLISRHLSKSNRNFALLRVDTSADFANAIKSGDWDLIISDYSLPAFSAQAVLFYLIHSDIDLPVIVVSGQAGEETAVQVMRWGAKDFVPKNNLQRLIPSIEREITENNLHKKSREMSNRLKFAEEKYQKFFDLNPAMIVVMSYPEERYLEANSSFIDTIGYSMEELHQKKSTEIGILTETESQRIHSLEDAFTNEFTTKMICKNGKEITCTVKGILVGEQNNYLLLVMSDITEKIKLEAEQKLLESKFYQDQKLQALGTLASGISHDFNNILSVIIGNAEFMLMQHCEDLNCKKRCERILQAGNRAADLIRQILTFARENNSTPQGVRLDKVLKETVSMLKDIIPAAINIKSQINEVNEVLAENNKIMQVVTNLCVNASHAISVTNKNGLITITLNNFKPETQFLAENPEFTETDYVMLSVSDNGCGISKENLPKIYDPFFTTKEDGKGTGLGLSTTYGIIKEFNGIITVDSEIGIGTAFSIYLPAIVAKKENEQQYTTDYQQSLPVFSGTVLYVDDEQAIVDIGIQILTKLGLQVHGFTDPEEAYTYFIDNYASFDLIITDLNMPKLSGQDLLTKIRKYKNIPAIICSGKESSFEENDFEHKSNYHLIKPVAVNDLIKTIKEIFSK